MATEPEERQPAELPLGAYLDGELDPVERRRVADALQGGDPELEQDLASLERLEEISRQLAAPPRVEASEWGRIWTRIEARTRSDGVEPAARVASEPVEGVASKPAEGGASKPAEGGASKLAEGGASEPAEGGASEPAEGVAAELAEGVAAELAEGGASKPAEGVALRPAEEAAAEPVSSARAAGGAEEPPPPLQLPRLDLDAASSRIQRLDAFARRIATPPPVDEATWRRIWSRIEETIRRSGARSHRGRGPAAGTGWLRVAGSLAAAAVVTALALPLALAPGSRGERMEPAVYVARVTTEAEVCVDVAPEEPTLAFSDAPGANDAIIEALETGGAVSSAVLYSSGPVVIDLRGGL